MGTLNGPSWHNRSDVRIADQTNQVSSITRDGFISRADSHMIRTDITTQIPANRTMIEIKFATNGPARKFHFRQCMDLIKELLSFPLTLFLLLFALCPLCL